MSVQTVTPNGFRLSTDIRRHVEFGKGQPYVDSYTFDKISEINYHDHSGGFEISLITHGYGYHYINDSVKEVAKGDVVFIDPQSWHSLYPIDRENSTRLTVINCVFDRMCLVKLGETIPELMSAFDFFSNIPQDHPLRLYDNCLNRNLTAFCKPLLSHVEMQSREKNELSAHLITLSISIMMLEVYRSLQNAKRSNKKQGLPSLVDQAANIIQSHFLDPDFMISSLYEQLFVSKSHLCAVFKEHMHISPLQLLNTLRIKHACKLIRQAGYCSKTLHLESGYSEYNTFYINFKKVTGFCVREYIKALNLCLTTV